MSPDCGVEAVGADGEVGRYNLTVSEGDCNCICRVFVLDDRGAFHLVLDFNAFFFDLA